MSVAIFLTEIRGNKFRKISQSLMFLPYFISWVVVSVMALNILGYDFGFINGLH
jgi:putative aldouronate transport system permease protein